MKSGSETVGDKLHGQKGNSPDPPLRSLNPAQCKRKWEHADSQDVGLEAATIERVRNSLLADRQPMACLWSCADNVRGLMLGTEARECQARKRPSIGRGAFRVREKPRVEALVDEAEVRMPV